MKKLIKSGVYGQKTGQQLRLKEKKKERENADAARLSAIQTSTKLVSFEVS